MWLSQTPWGAKNALMSRVELKSVSLAGCFFFLIDFDFYL